MMVKVLEGESGLEVFAAGVTETEWVLEIHEMKDEKQVYRGWHPAGKVSELHEKHFD